MHLRAVVLDNRVLHNWSMIIPMSYLHELGTSAMRVRLGDSIIISRGFNVKTVRDHTEQEIAETYTQQLKDQLCNVLSAFISHSDRIYEALDSAE